MLSELKNCVNLSVAHTHIALFLCYFVLKQCLSLQSTRAFFEYFALSDTRRELWDTHHRTLMGDSAISVALKTLDLQTERLLSTLEAYVSVAATLLRHKMLHPAKKGTSFAIRPVEHAAQLVTRDLERALDLVLANLREVLGRATKTVKALKDMTEQVAKERVEGKLSESLA